MFYKKMSIVLAKVRKKAEENHQWINLMEDIFALLLRLIKHNYLETYLSSAYTYTHDSIILTNVENVSSYVKNDKNHVLSCEICIKNNYEYN